MERNDRQMQSEAGERSLGTDVTAEFTLPDYRPEIKRLLRVKAVTLPIDKYIGGNATEISGTVEFQALYAAADGSLWCVTQREDYRLSCPIDLDPDFSTAGGLVCDVKIDAENVTGRVSAPRKLTARCRVRAKVRTLADRTLAEGTPQEDADSVERMTGTVTAARVFMGESAPMTFTEEILLDGREAPVRVISADGEVFPSEVNVTDGEITCRGDVCLSLLCVAEPEETVLPDETPTKDGANDCVPASAAMPYTVTRRLPFTVGIPVDGAETGCAACAWGTCSEIAVTVEEGRILCEVTCVLYARAERNEDVSYTRDMFSTVRACEPVFRTLPTERSVVCRNGNFSLTATKPLSEVGIRPASQVIDADAQIACAAPERAKGSYLLPGTARVRVLLRNADGEYSTAEFDVPFRYETPAPADADESSVAGDPIVRAVTVKARVDGEKIGVEAELAVAMSLHGTGEVSALCDLRMGETVPKQGAACVICYPSASDTPWTIAKRYHTPLSSLLAKNKLSSLPADAPLSGVPYLVV